MRHVETRTQDKSSPLAVVAAALVPVLLINYAFWRIDTIMIAPTGGRIFDTMFAGYGLEDFRQNLTALGPEGIRVYLRIMLPLDSIYPLAYGYAALVVWRMVAGRISVPVYRQGPALILIAVICDYVENVRLGMLMSGGIPLTGSSVLWTAGFTVAKWFFVAAFLAALVAGIVKQVRGGG